MKRDHFIGYNLCIKKAIESGNNQMNKKYFTKEEMEDISCHPFVESVSPTIITYSDEFKRIFIVESENGKLPRQIFKENGFDVELLGGSRIRKAAYRWRQAYKKYGVLGLTDSRKNHSAKPRNKELTLEENNARLVAQVHLLKAENELLKKLNMMERMMGKKK